MRQKNDLIEKIQQTLGIQNEFVEETLDFLEEIGDCPETSLNLDSARLFIKIEFIDNKTVKISSSSWYNVKYNLRDNIKSILPQLGATVGPILTAEPLPAFVLSSLAAIGLWRELIRAINIVIDNLDAVVLLRLASICFNGMPLNEDYLHVIACEEDVAYNEVYKSFEKLIDLKIVSCVKGKITLRQKLIIFPPA
ncbi:MAG: hypothetical protein R3F48_00720 [Candidatus Zixiibacteriota bacterium]